MAESFGSELVHLRCGACGHIASLSLQSLEENAKPVCPYCGAVIAVDLVEARGEARREARELDEAVDGLGSAD